MLENLAVRLKNIGVIVIDEEHEQSYSSETHPRYTTSIVAEERRRSALWFPALNFATSFVWYLGDDSDL